MASNNIMRFAEWMMHNFPQIYFTLWDEYETQKEE